MSGALYTLLVISILLNLYSLAYHFYRQRKMKINKMETSNTITMKTKEDSEVSELSSASNNESVAGKGKNEYVIRPVSTTVKIDVDSSKTKD